MDIYFEALKATDSRDKAAAALKKELLKRRLNMAGDIAGDGMSYEEALLKFGEIKQLLMKKGILDRITENRE